MQFHVILLVAAVVLGNSAVGEQQSLDSCAIRVKRSVQHEFQHVVAIGWNTSKGIEYGCGGSLITSKFVLTVAHCAADGDAKVPTVVKLGLKEQGRADDSSLSQIINIKEFRTHPQFRFSKKYYDIALIELEREVELNDAICTACLWLEDTTPEEAMSAIGFVSPGFSPNFDPILRNVTLKEISGKECGEILPLSGRTLPDGLVKEQFCAGSDDQDTCEGDSGSPLQVERAEINGDMIPLIVGLVSFGTPCIEGSVGVYTRVSPYKDWIEEVTGQSFDYGACSRASQCKQRKRTETKIESPPNIPTHRVGLLWNESNPNPYQCGATILLPNQGTQYAITSAYCAKTKQGPPKFVITGPHRTIVAIEAVHVHPEYKPGEPENDIAVLRLPRSLHESDGMLPAKLCRRDGFLLDETDYSAYRSPSHSTESIQDMIFERYVIRINNVDVGECTSPEYRESDLLCGKSKALLIPKICEVDYGGPVNHVGDFMNIPYLYGVVSTLSKGCTDELVATRIYRHIDWIISITH
ncbi:serine protease 27 isoform X2 [Culex quinquefasciatus]|uniref:serine protease 27 isoform X2 n=1 Tax=Culex quinquefasciatus TaxID=7176 RepID=UPI0018E2CCD1|nr:serine protease 27 isoform X2 [Culex quinquefasciatus]